MNNPSNDSYSQTGEWLVSTARRNPEALLLLAAGCVLLMRSGTRTPHRESSNRHGIEGRAYSKASNMPDLSQGLSHTAEKAADYAADIKDRVSATANTYTQNVSEYAADARRNISEGSQRLQRQARTTVQTTVDRVLRDQPLAIAVVGLAAGAAVAAAFPGTEVENRTLGTAHEALTSAVGQAGQTVMGAAGKAGERLKAAAEERGLSSQGLKELAKDVTDTFTDAVGGKDKNRDPTMVPESPASPSAFRSQNAGEAGNSVSRDPGRTPASTGPGGGSIR